MPTIATDLQVEILPEIIALRHAIHRHPDLSGREQATAKRLLDYLGPFKPDEVRTELGGCGLGAGVDCGNLHGPDYDFPDAILGSALKVMWGIAAQLNRPVQDA